MDILVYQLRALEKFFKHFDKVDMSAKGYLFCVDFFLFGIFTSLSTLYRSYHDG